MDSRVTGDFIFGTLGTDELRLAHEKGRLQHLWHGSRVSPPDPQPGDEVTFIVTIGVQLSVSSIEILLTRDGSRPTGSSEIVACRRQSVEWSTIAWGYVETWTATIPAEHEELWRYQIRAVTPNGQTIWADVHEFTGEPGLFALSIDTAREPSWLGNAVIYQVFVDRFARDHGQPFERQPTLNDIWGGTLRGVIEHLDYIQKLGANAIWLSPIFPSPTHHGYDVTDYMAIEQRLGSIEDFDELVAAAHARGIRIILDFVASHCSNLHPVFQRALTDPQASERDYFIFNRDGSYESFFGVESMPRINGDSEPALDWLLEATDFWLDRGVDGFRLDYAIGQSLQFWTLFKLHVQQRNPQFALIAEAVDSAETLRSYRGRLDGVLDFLFLEKVRSFIGFEESSAAEFWRFCDRHMQWFADGPRPVTFLDNHDMNRLLWIAQGDTRKLKIAALVQLTLPSPAVIYYGTEVGLSQWHDLEFPDGSRRMEESRTPMLWGADQDRDLLDFYRSLLFWRKKFSIDQLEARLVHAGDDGTLVYTIGPWLVVINLGGEPADIALDEPGSIWLALGTDRDVQLQGNLISLPPYSGAILANQLAR